MKKNVLIVLIFSLSWFSCTQLQSTDRPESVYTWPININNLRVNMEFLASDELEGRDTASRGEQLAALYIKSDLKKNGIKMLDELESFYQPVPLTMRKFDPGSRLSLIDSNGTTLTTFNYGDDFIGSSRGFVAMDTVAEVIFAGFGISAPEYEYDDYSELDVQNKFVLVWAGEPESSDSSFFAGEQATKYSSLSTKQTTADNLGALGILMVSKTEEKYGWDGIKNYAGKGSLSLSSENSGQSDTSNSMPRIILKTSTMESILNYNSATLNYDSIKTVAASGQEISRFTLPTKVHLNLDYTADSSLIANNVIGCFPGNDPELKNEYVAIGAHYDHVGISENGIYNGADDNASGTVVTLEVAKAVAFNKDFKRSVLFMFYSGEEKGLLGSRFLTENLQVTNDIVAHINLDMVGRGSSDSIYNIGSAKLSKDFSNLVREANERSVNFAFDYTFDAPDDPNRYYYRSDHYNFAKKGIPVVFFFDNMKADYHKVTDTAEKINYMKMARLSDLCYNIIELAANRPEKPVLD